jgi:hypothetical protein
VILSTASLYPWATWTEGRETLLDDMRLRISKRALVNGWVVGGTELIEIIPIHLDDNPHVVTNRWVSSSEENATHVKVTIEQEVVE